MPSAPPDPELFRRLPSVEKILKALGDTDDLPRSLTTHLVQQEIARMRTDAQLGKEPPPFDAAVTHIRAVVERFARSRIQPVINATGVLIHTNLGRSPLASAVGDAMREAACQYDNLEFDMDTGERGRRGSFLETTLAVLTGAEAATVTNNCAAALVLILRHLAGGERREVVIPRGQLIEIGGGFRIPEIMETSGAKLREIGATNKVSLADYRKAIGPQTAMLLRVHRSNFHMEGFVGEPTLAELVALGREYQLPVVEDLGSGAVVSLMDVAGTGHEPTPQESLAQGVDLVCFSGDKLFGGPQAGIICGKASLVAGIKRDPLFRALRCDKIILTALQETALTYLRHSQGEDSSPDKTPLPLLQMLALREEHLLPRAAAIVASLTDAPVTAAAGTGDSRCGGGTMPGSSLPSVTVDLSPKSLSVPQFTRRLREGQPAVIGYIAGDRFKLDLRTVFPEQDATLLKAILNALQP
ncbi:MAG TPA: L-seryl-tRNA(Sec) selenium transferase [Verrucomicrobiales bacterium]|nr:L-seryl-tRNA(Sec) selenium transferase [Verrucomicrobiales bacterium]